MTTQTQRTPGPWTVAAYEVGGRCAIEADDWGQPTEVALASYKDDAAFIVTACNAHDELVAALQDARDALADLNHREEDGGFLMDKIDAALALVYSEERS